MKVLSRAVAAAAILLSASGTSQATRLLDLIDAPAQDLTAYSLSFVATTSFTTLSVGGYQQDSAEYARRNELLLNNTGPNLLGTVWSYTPAPSLSR